MNFAATTLILILLIIPGFCFNLFFYTGDFERISIKRTAIEEVAGVIGVSFFFHALAVLLINVYFPNTCRVNLMYVSTLMYGVSPTSDIKLEEIMRGINNNLDKIVYYNTSLSLVGFISGRLARHYIRVWRLDLLLKPFRFANPWFYILSGESKFFKGTYDSLYELRCTQQVDLVYIDALVTTGNSGNPAILYRGILQEYRLREGSLEAIFLSNVTRRTFGDEIDKMELSEKATGNPSATSIFYNIPGSYLILLSKNIVNLNIEYIISEKKNSPKTIFCRLKSFLANLFKKSDFPQKTKPTTSSTSSIPLSPVSPS